MSEETIGVKIVIEDNFSDIDAKADKLVKSLAEKQYKIPVEIDNVKLSTSADTAKRTLADLALLTPTVPVTVDTEPAKKNITDFKSSLANQSFDIPVKPASSIKDIGLESVLNTIKTSFESLTTLQQSLNNKTLESLTAITSALQNRLKLEETYHDRASALETNRSNATLGHLAQEAAAQQKILDVLNMQLTVSRNMQATKEWSKAQAISPMYATGGKETGQMTVQRLIENQYQGTQPKASESALADMLRAEEANATKLNAAYQQALQNIAAKKKAEEEYNRAHAEAIKINNRLDEERMSRVMSQAAYMNRAHEAALAEDRRRSEERRRMMQLELAAEMDIWRERGAMLASGRAKIVSQDDITAMREYEAAQRNLTSTTGGLLQKFNQWQMVLMSIGVTLSARQVLDYADDWVHFTNAVAISTEKTGHAVEMQDRLFKLAQDNRAPLDAITSIYLRMSRASESLNMSQGQTVQMIDVVTKSLAIMGTKPEMVRGGLLQLEQALGGVTVRGQEFKSILDSMPLLMANVAKHYLEADKAIKLQEASLRGASQAEIDAIKAIDTHALSIGQFRNMMYAGEVASKAFGLAINMSQAEVDAAFAKTHKTFAQAFTYMSNEFTKWVGDANSATHGSDLFYSSVKALADNLTNAVKTLEILAAGAIAYSLAANKAAIATFFAEGAVATLNKTLLLNPFARAISILAALGVALWEFKDDINVFESGFKLGDVFEAQFNRIDNAIEHSKEKFKSFKEAFSAEGFFKNAIGMTGLIGSESTDPLAIANRFSLTKSPFINSPIVESPDYNLANYKPTSFASQVNNTAMALMPSGVSTQFLNAHKLTEEEQLQLSLTKQLEQAEADRAKQTAKILENERAVLSEKLRVEGLNDREQFANERVNIDLEKMRNLEKENGKVRFETLEAYKKYLTDIKSGIIDQMLEANRKMYDEQKAATDLRNKAASDKAAKESFSIDFENMRTRMADFEDKYANQLKTIAVNNPLQMSFEMDESKFMTAAGKFKSTIEQAAAKNKVPADLIAAIIQTESTWNPKAVSKTGVTGLSQFDTSTGRAYGITDKFNTEQNINATAAYLSDLLKQFKGDVQKAVTAYNAGAKTVLSGNLSSENINFAPKVLGLLGTGGSQAAQEKSLAIAKQREIVEQAIATWQAKAMSATGEGAAEAKKEVEAQYNKLTMLDKTFARQDQFDKKQAEANKKSVEQSLRVFDVEHRYDGLLAGINDKLAYAEKIKSLIAEHQGGALPFLEQELNANVALAQEQSARLAALDAQYNYEIKLLEQGAAKEQQAEKLKQIEKERLDLRSKLQQTEGEIQTGKSAYEQVLTTGYTDKDKLKSDTIAMLAGSSLEGSKAAAIGMGYSTSLNKLKALSGDDYLDAKKQLDELTAKRRVQLEVEIKAASMQRAVSEMQSLATNLEHTFGKVGKSIGDIGTALVGTVSTMSGLLDKTAELQKSYEIERSAAEKSGASKEDLIKIDDSYAKQRMRNEDAYNAAAIDGMANIAGAAANLFSKQSAGRKALHAVEVGLHGIEMAMSIAKIATNLAEGASKFFAQSGWGGFAGVAAMAAVMAGFGIAAFGGSSEPKDLTTPETKTTGSVLGDSGAASNSIKSIVDTLNSIHASEYIELQAINSNFKNLVEMTTTGTAQALRERGAFSFSTNGMQGGNTGASEKQFLMGLGTTAISAGMAAAGVGTGMVTGALASAIGAVSSVSTGLTGALVGLSSSIMSGGLAAAAAMGGIGLLVGGVIFGLSKLLGIGKVKFEAVGGGIVSQAQDYLLNGMQQAVAVYDYSKIKKTVTGWFSDDVTYYEVINGLDKPLSKLFTGIFNQVGTTLIKSADILGESELLNQNVVIPKIKLALKPGDRNNADNQKKIEDALNKSSDEIAAQAFGRYLAQFQRIGEGMLETVSRLTNQAVVAKTGFEKLGLTVNLTGLGLVSFSDSLARAFGGIKEMQSALEDMYNMFTTDTQQLADATVKVQAFMDKLKIPADAFIPTSIKTDADVMKVLGYLNDSLEDASSLRQKFLNATPGKPEGEDKAVRLANQLSGSLTPEGASLLKLYGGDITTETLKIALAGSGYSLKGEDGTALNPKLWKPLIDYAEANSKSTAEKLAAQKTINQDWTVLDALQKLGINPRLNSKGEISSADYPAIVELLGAMEDELSANVVGFTDLRKSMKLVTSEQAKSADDLKKFRLSIADWVLNKQITTVGSPEQQFQVAKTDFERQLGILKSSTSSQADKLAAMGKVTSSADAYISKIQQMYATGTGEGTGLTGAAMISDVVNQVAALPDLVSIDQLQLNALNNIDTNIGKLVDIATAPITDLSGIDFSGIATTPSIAPSLVTFPLASNDSSTSKDETISELKAQTGALVEVVQTLQSLLLTQVASNTDTQVQLNEIATKTAVNAKAAKWQAMK